MFINDLFISGLNRVTESAGKELMLAQITEIQDDSESPEETQTVKQKLKNIQVKEVLLRRYVPSQERESVAVDSKEPSKAKSASPPKEVSSGPGDQLNIEITAAGNKVRDLKTKKAEKAEIDSAVAVLLDLKAKYKAATGQDWKPPGGGESKKNESKKGGDGGGKKKKEQPKKEPKKELKKGEIIVHGWARFRDHFGSIFQ